MISGIIAANSSSERRCKVALLAAILLLTAAGPAIHLVSTIFYTAAVTFPAELANDRGSFYFASILFRGKSVGPVGPILVLSGIAGAVISAFQSNRRTLRIYAITLLTYLVTRLTFAVFVILFDFWRGPAPLYFEFFVIPLYAIFAVQFWGSAINCWRQLRGWAVQNNSVTELRIISACIILILMLAIGTSRRDFGFVYPPAPNRFTELLVENTGLPPGSAFRGRTATMTGRAITGNVNWLELHGLDGALAATARNELRLVGLNYFDIPTLFEYTPTISPAFYAVMTRLLALPGDRQMRNVIVTRQINSRVLAMLGVHFVITDRKYDGPARLRATDQIGGRKLFLYEIADPNLGDYSPTIVTQAGTAGAILDRLADPRFDPRREIIADIGDRIEGLVPALHARLDFDGASLKLHAESDGRSVLLLPLEFSSCIALRGPDAGKISIFRANLLETGVLFSRHVDVTLSVRTGAFLHPACRLRDFFETRELGIEKVPPQVAAPPRGNT